MAQLVFDAETDDGDSLLVDHRGGEIEVIVAGPFNGATVTLSALFAGFGTTYVPVDQGTWTEGSVKLLKTVNPCTLKLTISDAGASTSITAGM